MTTKPDYGIDAPPIIRRLSIIGIIFCAAASKGLSNQTYSLTISYVFLFTGLVSIILAFLMLYSSKRGKCRERDKLINSLTEISGDETILDIGCGKGLLLVAAAKKLKTGKAIGIDIWNVKDLAMNYPSTTINNAQLEGVVSRVDVITGDMRSLPLKENSIDIVMASMAVHNVRSKEERRKTMQEINRVLKPEGKIAIIDFKFTDEYAGVLKELGRGNVSLSGLKIGMFPPVRVVRKG